MTKFLFSFPQWLRGLLSLLYFCILALLSMVPSEDLPVWQPFPGFDKLLHLGLYFGLTLLACWTLHAEENRKRILCIVLFAITWGMLMEISQLIMQEGRDFEWMDEVGNAIGAFIGGVLYAVAAHQHKGKA